MVLLTYLLDLKDWRRRFLLYLEYSVFFLGVWALVFISGFETVLAFLLLSSALIKDILVDMFLIRRSGSPAFYDWVEHNPLNVIFLVLIASGAAQIEGSFMNVSLELFAVFLSTLDLIIDGGQDIGVEWKRLKVG